MAAAVALGGADDYREWARLYATALARQAAVRQVREFCDELIGPLDAPLEQAAGGASAWEAEVLGIPKRQLLREVVLPALSANRALQRLLAEYVEMLQSL